jgi:hypothetical protein
MTALHNQNMSEQKSVVTPIYINLDVYFINMLPMIFMTMPQLI